MGIKRGDHIVPGFGQLLEWKRPLADIHGRGFHSLMIKNILTPPREANAVAGSMVKTGIVEHPRLLKARVLCHAFCVEKEKYGRLHDIRDRLRWNTL